jgi:hypothetical protein
VVAGNEDHGGAGQSFAESLELPEGKDDCGVAWPDGMKEIAREDDYVGSSGNDAVNGGAEGLGNVGFPLIDARRGLPMVLPDAQVGVRDMGKFHWWRMGPKAVKSKQLTHRRRGYPP